MNPYLLPFEDFFTYLQQQGFELGVDDFLQIQALLNLLPEDCPPEKLKSLLAPLVVGNEEEQIAFYQAFDHYFEEWIQHQAVQQPNVAPKKAEKKAPFKAKEKKEEENRYDKYGNKDEFHFNDFLQQHLQTIGGVFVGLLLLVMGVFLYFNMSNEVSDYKVKIEITEYEQAAPINEVKTLKEEEKIADKTSQKSAKKTETTHSKTTSNPRNWEIGTSEASTPSPKAPDKTWKMDTNLSKELSLKKAMASKSGGSFGFWFFVLVVSLFYISWVARWFFKVKKEFQLQALENIHPPQYWNIRVPKSELNLTHSKSFKKAATNLQTRQTVPTHRIDVPQTVASTIAAAGFPSFEFLQRSELPEYLLLIDQSSVKDQQSKWFEMWFEGLKQQEVLVHRYFFHNNTEWFWDAEQRKVSFQELQHRFGECRLVVIADGSQHSLVKKGNVFTDWKEKMLLSTVQLSKSATSFWEETGGFSVLPAKTESLNHAVDLFEGKPSAASNAVFTTFAPKTDWKNLNVRDTLKELKRQLNEVSFRWLCATAVYPEMNWNLTLFIGETLFDGEVLMKEENVLPLVGLPWFKRGEMPEKLRRVLLRHLNVDDKKMVKEAILHLLQLHPLIEDEYNPEFFDYQLYIALERARIHAHDSEKMKALYQLSQQKQFEQSRYKMVVLRFLDEQKESLSLGKSFGEWFEQKDNAKAATQGKFFYPKANFENRWGSMVVKTLRMAFVNLFVLLFVLLVFDNLGVPKTVGFLVGVGFALFGCFRTVDGEVGGWHDESSKWLVLVNTRTNQACGFWKVLFRRAVDLLPLALVAVCTYLFASSMTYFWVFFGVLALVNLILIDVGKGRRLGDFLLGTQVVNKFDFEKGRWEKNENYLKIQQ